MAWQGVRFAEEMPTEEIETERTNNSFKKCYCEVVKGLRVRGGVWSREGLVFFFVLLR